MNDDNINKLNEKVNILKNEAEKLAEKITMLNIEYTKLFNEYQEKYIIPDYKLKKHISEKKKIKRKVIDKNEKNIKESIFSLLYALMFFLLIIETREVLIEYIFATIVSNISFVVSSIACGIINVSTIKNIISDYKNFKKEYDEKLVELQQKVNCEERQKAKEQLEEKEIELKKVKKEYDEVCNLEKSALSEITKFKDKNICNNIENNISGTKETKKVRKRIK